MKHLVIIGNVFPEPQSTAAGKRMMQLIRLFKKHNYAITFLSSASVSEYAFDLKKWNIETKSISINDSNFDILIKNLQPGIVLFDRMMTEEQFGWRVSQAVPNAIKILDTEDLHFLRKAREKAFKNNKPLEFKDYLNDIFKREIASIYRCDVSLIISEFEMDLLQNTFKIDASILHYIPLLVDKIDPNLIPFEERKDFISIGNFLHEPNWQTVLTLKKYWKNIRKVLPQAEMHIYGAYVTEKAQQLHQPKEGFLIKGRAKSVADVFNKARVLLAPIPFGAGIKGKLLDSMEFGLPNVTTPMGAEGMTNKDWNGFICDNEKDFIDKSIELYTHSDTWKKAQQNGYQIIENKFKTSLFESDFMDRINDLLHHTEKHRNQNFLGQIFNFHTLRSTEFMSRWIEEKNKK